MPPKPAPKPAPALDAAVADYRYDATRPNLPEAGLAAQGRIQERPKQRYAYDPHLPPTLRFDPTGDEDRLPALLEAARSRPLTDEEARTLADALRHREPWLEWSGKREQAARGFFEVEPVALHIHERVAAKAILAAAARRDVQRSLFADPELGYRESVQFYQHQVGWANRLILGDSLQVMASLAERENLAGKVQMIYVDPPYGIKFASNFQPLVGRVEVKEREQDLSREPETIRAYRDTWRLGVHSYLAYLRERLALARMLLTDSGSIFMQISDENLHLVRSLLDDVFGPSNFAGLIPFSKTGGQSTTLLSSVADYLVWYAKDKSAIKFTPLYLEKTAGAEGATGYTLQENPATGEWKSTSAAVRGGGGVDSEEKTETSIFDGTPLISAGATPEGSKPYYFAGQERVPPPNTHWKTTQQGLARLSSAGRIISIGNRIEYKRYLADFPATVFSNLWLGLGERGFTGKKLYAVQTAAEVISRCMLMTTDPGDLVLDPTSGSGTTAYVAEKWGRRWIAIDTSRVANAIARQRLLTASFDYYRLRDEEAGVDGGFVYKTVPHITLKSIAQNQALDPVFARHEPILAARLEALNAALAGVDGELRTRLQQKLAAREKAEGKRSVTDADRRRWLLPKADAGWKEWEVPFDADPEWPPALQSALTAYRAAWRAKMDEVNATIAASAEQEALVDQPQIDKAKTRVTGPFTVESVLPAEQSLDAAPSPVRDFEGDLETFGDGPANGRGAAAGDGLADAGVADDPQNAEAFVASLLGLLRADGARFHGNRTVPFDRLEPLSGGVLHAEGEWRPDGETPRRVAVSFGPQVGNVSGRQVELGLRAANRRGYDDLVFAGFGFDDAAQAAFQDDADAGDAGVRAHMVQIRPDVMMGDLLKTTPNSQIFTVVALPRTRLDERPDGTFTVTMEGMDVYDPVANTIVSTNAGQVAAWFLDADYDGRTFCICQAFFPDKSAWDKIARSLKGVIDEEAFAAFAGDTSLPFAAGEHGRACVKVIDPRGNEATRVHALRPDAVFAGVGVREG